MSSKTMGKATLKINGIPVVGAESPNFTVSVKPKKRLKKDCLCQKCCDWRRNRQFKQNFDKMMNVAVRVSYPEPNPQTLLRPISSIKIRAGDKS